MSQGWICVHRKLLEWEWFSDHNTFRLFMYLMLKANHQDKKWKGIIIKRGQHLTSLDSLCAGTGMTKSKIRTSLNKLKSTRDIAHKTNSQHTVITVINYNLYQSIDTQTDKPIANESQTDDKPIATNNNVNNENNVITDGFSHWWNLYPSSRRINKSGCLTKWKSKCKGLSDDSIVDLINNISKDIDLRIKQVDDIKFIPQTTTYLNQERWNDGQ